MAEVNPNVGIPTQSPNIQAPDDVQHIEATPASFGAPIAEGLGKAGEGLMDLSTFYNKVSADDATNNFLTGSRALMYGDPSKGPAVGPDGQPITTPDGGAVYQGGFYGLHGRNAMDAYPQVKEQLNELLEEQKNTLHTPASRLQFDTENRRYLNQALGEMGVHASQQQFAYGKDVNTTRATIGLNDVSRVANNDIASAHAGMDVIDAYKNNAIIDGFDPAGAILKARQEIALVRIRSLIGSPNASDRTMADKVLNDNAGLLGSMPEYDRIVATVKQANFDAISVTETDKFTDQALAEAAAKSKASGGVPSAPGAPVTGDALHQAFAHQESGANPNAPVSAKGAHGQYQITPATFAEYAKPGERIDNPADNAAVGQRLLDHYNQLYNGDTARVAVAYFSGPQNVAPAGSATPWIHDRDDGTPGHPGTLTSTYVANIQRRLGGGGPAQTGATSSIADNLRQDMPDILARAQADAERLFPNYGDQQQRYVQGIERRLNQTISQQDQQYLSDTHMVMVASEGATSFGDIRAKGPEVSAALDRMSIESPMAYNSLEHRFDVESKGKAEEFGSNFSSYLSRALAPTTDPNRITNPMQLNSFLGAGKDAAITTAGQKAIADITAIRGTPQGEAFVTQARTVLGQMHGDLTFSSQPADRFDPKGEARFSAFSAMALPVLVNAYKTGTIDQVLNPKSPDYIGNLAQHFMRSPAEIIKDRLDLGETDRFAITGAAKGESIFDNATLGRNFLRQQVKSNRLSQSEAIRIGEDYGWFARPAAGAPATPAKAAPLHLPRLTAHGDENQPGA